MVRLDTIGRYFAVCRMEKLPDHAENLRHGEHTARSRDSEGK